MLNLRVLLICVISLNLSGNKGREENTYPFNGWIQIAPWKYLYIDGYWEVERTSDKYWQVKHGVEKGVKWVTLDGALRSANRFIQIERGRMVNGCCCNPFGVKMRVCACPIVSPKNCECHPDNDNLEGGFQ